jgi:primosomal protein N' (replication factor Y)
MYAEVVVDRPIIKRQRRDFVDTPAEADLPYPENAEEEVEHDRPDNPLALAFHYRVPPHLAGQIQPGQWVAVPFRTEQLTGIVVTLSETSPIEETKPIVAILDPVPMLNGAQLRLARWLADETLAPLSTCVRLFLPPGSGRKSELMLKPTTTSQTLALKAPEQILLTYLRQQGSVPLAEVEAGVAESLLEKGLARKEAVLSQPRVGPKIDRTVELLISPDEVEAIVPTLGRSSKPAQLLLYLANLDDPLPALAEVLAQTGCSREQVKTLAQRGWVEIIPKQSYLAVAPPIQTRLRRAEGDPQTLITELTDLESEQALLHRLLAQPQPLLADEVVADTPANQSALNTLIKKEFVVRLDEPERLTLTLPINQLNEAIIALHGSRKQVQVLRLLASEDGPVWVGWVYAQTEANLSTLKELASANLVALDDARRWRDPLAGRSFTLDNPPTLSQEQQAVWQAVGEAWKTRHKGAKPILIHGVTGSGKTEIYLRAIEVALKAGYGAIMLVPEITLAAQTVERVAARFPGQVAVWHSALAPGERYDTWERVRQGNLPIVVGPRSALFAPVKKLGVVVVDEEHEPAYKQRDRLPIFHAREAALELARLSQALAILGSATPDVVTYRKAERGEYQLLTLPYRMLAHVQHLAVQQALLKRSKAAGNSDRKPKTSLPSPVSGPESDFVMLPLPQVEIVDLREELKAGNRTIFSRSLQDAMRETLRREEQVILFLNRRGTASFVICRDCGYVARCPRCETSLTYHASGELMICHYCGHREKTPERCPQCRSEKIRYFGLGTQRVEEAVKTMFSQAQVIRWDWDTTRQHGSHDVFLQHFLTGRANIMVGTQMVAKGLDLPLVTLVGVISADTAMYLPDFRAAERTFQLLMQVAGRAGRSPLGGRVIIQTYNPDQVAIQAASQHDYLGFYETELAFRQEQRYPPFKRLALLLYSGPGPERSAAQACELAERLRLHLERRGIPAVEIIGPTPDYVPRVRSQFRWHILLRAPNPAAVLRPLLPLPPGWRIDIDPVTLL